MRNDPKQERLRELFSELRRIKQQALPERKDDPVEQAYHDVRVQRAIENVERKIEGVMRDDQ